MTVLLLDTHAYVWALTDPDRLSDRARTAIETPTNTVLVSAATAWEIAIKYRAGTWPEADILLAQHDALTRRLGAHPLDISAADAIRAGSLDWNHPDPFDRMLAAQSLLHQAAVVTRDRAFRHLRGLSINWLSTCRFHIGPLRQTRLHRRGPQQLHQLLAVDLTRVQRR